MSAAAQAEKVFALVQRLRRDHKAVMELGASPLGTAPHDDPGELAVSRTRSWYDGHATAYADQTELYSMEGHLKAFLDLLPAEPVVVDLGSGGGRDLAAMARARAKASGVDNVATLAEMARRRSGCPVIVADMRDLPFPSEHFDGVWASASLLHLPRDAVSTALRESLRVLKVGGYLFCSMKSGVGDRVDADGRWFSYYERDQWCDLVRDAGFTIVSCVEEVQTRDGLSPPRWLNVLARRP